MTEEKTRVVVHALKGSKKALDACLLAERLYQQGRRVVMWVGDAGRAGVLDQYLWTFAQYSFVPHVLWNGHGTVDEPVVIVTGAPANPNGADVLVVLDRIDVAAAVALFDEIHELDAASDESAAKAEAWAEAGAVVEQSG